MEVMDKYENAVFARHPVFLSALPIINLTLKNPLQHPIIVEKLNAELEAEEETIETKKQAKKLIGKYRKFTRFFTIKLFANKYKARLEKTVFCNKLP